MTDHLPIPASRHQLAIPAASAAAHGAATGGIAHRRRPILERVSCLSFGGGLLAAAGGRVCCVWDTRTYELIARLVLGSPIGAVWVERSNGRVLMLSSGSDVAVFDLPSSTPRHSYRHEAPVTGVHISDAGLVAGSVDTLGRVEVHDIAAGHLVRRLDTLVPAGSPTVFIERGGSYAIVDSETHSLLYDVATGDLRRRFPYDPLEALDLEGTLLYSTLVAPSARWLSFFDCAKHAHARCVHDLGSKIQSIDIDNDLGLVLAATVEGRIGLFDLQTGQPRGHHESFTLPLMFARFGAQASIYVAGGEALVMHLVEGQHVRSYYDETPPLVAMALPEKSESVVLSNRDGGVTPVSLRDGRRMAPIEGHQGSVSVVTCFGDRVASGAYDGFVRVSETASSNQLLAIDLAQGPVQAIAADAQAGRLWVGTWAGRVNEVDLEHGALRSSFEVFPSSVRSLAHDAQRGLLCAGGNGGELRLLNTAGGALKPLATGLQPGTAYRALFDADGSILATASDGVRRYQPGALTVCESYPSCTIRWFDCSAGRLVSLSLDGELTLFDAATREVMHRAVIDAPFIHRSVVFLGPSRILVASADGLVRVFDEKLQEVAALELLRDGFLWSTAPQDSGHPGWLHTDRPELIDVGERAAHGALHSWRPADPRRARHLAKWTSASHVMRIVRGDAAALAPAAGRLASALALAPVGHRLSWSR